MSTVNFSRFKDWFEEIDQFGAPITPRYKRENDYKTITGACLSLILIILFGFVFINSAIEMAHRTNITTTINAKEEKNPSLYSTTTQQFIFALGIPGQDMNDTLRYFDINVASTQSINGTKSNISLMMIPCEAGMWMQLGNDYQEQFETLGLSKWLCPAPGQPLELAGKHSSSVFKYLKVSVGQCTGAGGYSCRSAAEIQNYLKVNDTFRFSFYFLNTILNPDEQDPTQLFLDDTHTFEFTPQYGTSVDLFFKNYNISTDSSLLPWKEYDSNEGITSEKSVTSQFQPSNGEYLRLYMRKSTRNSHYDRHYYKLDEMLAYVGGLFGLIIAAFKMPMVYYNNCCFELDVADTLFDNNDTEFDNNDDKNNNNANPARVQPADAAMDDRNQQNIPVAVEAAGQPAGGEPAGGEPAGGEPAEQKNKKARTPLNFNILWYTIYLPLYFFKRVCGWTCKISWFSRFYEAMEQVKKQTDIGKFVERFIYLDRMSKVVLNENQRVLIHLFRKQRINQLDDHTHGVRVAAYLSSLADGTNGTEPGLTREELYAIRKALKERENSEKNVITQRIMNLIDPLLPKLISNLSPNLTNYRVEDPGEASPDNQLIGQEQAQNPPVGAFPEQDQLPVVEQPTQVALADLTNAVVNGHRPPPIEVLQRREETGAVIRTCPAADSPLPRFPPSSRTALKNRPA